MNSASAFNYFYFTIYINMTPRCAWVNLENTLTARGMSFVGPTIIYAYSTGCMSHR
jgi:3-methyladenine DNA glycosylase Tag